MATLRDRSERTPRALARVLDFGVVVCLSIGAARLFGLIDTRPVGIIGGVGFLVAAGAFILIHALGIRCPRCGGRMERHYDVGFLRVRGPRHCPRCRVDLDGPASQAAG